MAVRGAGEGVAGVALLVEFDGVADYLDAGGDEFGVCGFVFELCEDDGGFGCAVLGEEPAGGVH